ncbi:hypothetical protein [Halalkalibacter akibai]|nr:hypothetical protein [Halalkalibacter akibai]
MTTITEVIQQLNNRKPLPPLCPDKAWDVKITDDIMKLTNQEITERENPSLLAGDAVKSGLLLWNDELDLSHTISQNMSEDLGSYWHGIMHRREGDFSNAKYWFRTTGNHAILPVLYEKASELSKEVKSWGAWDPYRFIDAVEHVVSNELESSPEAEVLRQIQVLEISLLLEFSRGV